ncbi:MAG: 4-hydroxythreonine-4-phosphate dehydrogenase PdxA [Prolixibacteraceae bacterium]|nr:4-hydroxythreonine-4-phosphate dehydrogenase PdxA [Prolixibacteraceae bacterium]MBN2649314.1 4-hydroxythreonine-4-phosphate dehydrogenase PdxA [Prolixibacteraceae bacterium]
MKNSIKVGITQGDINGIGYEVIIKALADDRMLELCTPVVYGSPKVAAYHKKVLDFEEFNFHQVREAAEADYHRVNIVNCCDDNVRVELGKPGDLAGEAAYMALEQAVNDLKEGKIDVLVTAPINKETVQSDVFNFPGHTEFLAQQSEGAEPLMLLITDTIKVGVVTGHLPLKDVPAAITKELILKKLQILHHSLVQDFACTNPRIAVLGLNPHAGDNGVLGNEEAEVIQPALDKAFSQGITAMGPYAADGFFGSGQQYKFDAILAMYHDQGLAPFKALTFDTGVNFTAGLPFVRTSPGHGTAFDIAGQGIASEESFKQAIYKAIDIFRNRQTYKEISRNPLPKYEIKANGESDHVDLTKEQDTEF